jgi:hypothetical protein
MSAQRLTLLLVAALVLGLLTVLFSAQDGGDSGTGELLLPNLADNINKIDRVIVTGPGDEPVVTLEQADNRWQVAGLGYSADVGLLRTNLIALSEARIVETKTADPQYYDRLGVIDIADPAATGVQLTLNSGDQQIAQVLIGNTGLGAGTGAYVRRNGEARSYLIEADLELGASRGEWLDSQIMDLPSSDVRRVRIEHTDGKLLELEKISRDATEFVVLGIPEGRSLSFPGIGNAIGAVLAKLELDDVSPANEFTPPGPPILARFETFDGLLIDAQSFRVADGWRTTFTASVANNSAAADTTSAAETDEANAVDEIDDDANGAATDQADAATRAASINARAGGWIYTLPGFKSDQLIKSLEDLLAAPAG